MKNIIDCKKYIQHKTEDVESKLTQIKRKFDKVPGISIINVGDNLESKIYVERKRRIFSETGFHIEVTNLPQNSTHEDVLQMIEGSNQKKDIHGIIVQLPLPSNFDMIKILGHINPQKDIEGFDVENIGKIALSNHFKGNIVLPCTVRGIIDLLDFYDIKIQGKEIVIVGKGLAVGLPISLYLMSQGATVTVCDRHSKNLSKKISTADIVIAASSTEKIIKPEWLTAKTIVIDVGTKVILKEDGTKSFIGNLDGKKVTQGYITPVPGGIGGITIVSAMRNTIDAFYKQSTTEAKMEKSEKNRQAELEPYSRSFGV